jgi:hypothetical protein
MNEHECVMDETALESARCHGGWVWCSVCFEPVRHYSSLRINPRTEPCTHRPWIPGPEELEEFRRDLDVALSSDFRLTVMSEYPAITREELAELGTHPDA